MRRDRKNKTILLSVLVALIFSMSIVFAAMSTTLKVKGTGLVSASEWSIKFENLSPATLKGAAQETTAPTIKNDTEIGEYSVVLKRTGDEVVYNFDIHNYGKVNAKIEELNIPTPVCTGNATDEEQKIADAQIVSESIAYTLTYSDGTEVNVGDTLKADEVKSLVLKLAYTGENMPSESVQITGLAITMKHAQDMSEPLPEEPSIDPSTIAGKTYNQDTKIVLDGTPVTVPGGATISGVQGEYENIDNGLVIYIIPDGKSVDWGSSTDVEMAKKTYDQFVWIPVPNAIAEDIDNDGDIDMADIDQMIAEEKYPLATKVRGTENYRGILYSFEEVDGKVVISDIDWSATFEGNREPTYLSKKDNDTNYNNVGLTKEGLQTQFDTMVEKVSENKGFWVGRYETSGTDTTDPKVRSIKDANSCTPHGGLINWYAIYRKQQLYSEKNLLSQTSSMIWGSQWDQIMIWMRNVKNNKDKVNTDTYYIINSIGMGNFSKKADGSEAYGRSANTGSSEDYKVKNIYDLAGNHADWTLEARGTEYRVLRRWRL